MRTSARGRSSCVTCPAPGPSLERKMLSRPPFSEAAWWDQMTGELGNHLPTHGEQDNLQGRFSRRTGIAINCSMNSSARERPARPFDQLTKP